MKQEALLIRSMIYCKNESRAMAYVVSYWIFTAEAPVECQPSQYVICGGRSGTDSGFYTSTPTSSCRYHLIMVHTH